MNMKGKNSVLVAILIALLLALPAGGSAGASRKSGSVGGAGALLSVQSSESSGVLVYEIENRAGFGRVHYWVNGTRTANENPWHIELIQPNGSVYALFNFQGITADGDRTGGGEGEGVAYAGVGATTLKAPEMGDSREPLIIDWSESVPGTMGRLVLAWVDQVAPIQFSLQFPPGTTLTPVASGTIGAYTVEDFHGISR